MTTPTTRCTRRRLTVENSHDLHRNPYSDPWQALDWAKTHQLLCDRCRRRIERMNTPEALQRHVARRLTRMQEVGE